MENLGIGTLRVGARRAVFRAARNALPQVVALNQFHHESGDAVALFEA